MKAKKIILYTIAVIAAILVLKKIWSYSWFDNHVGNITSEWRELNSFESIEVSDGIEVKCLVSHENKIKLEAPENVLPNIVCKVKNNTLVLSVDAPLFQKISSIKATVYYNKNPNAIETSSGAYIVYKDTIFTNTLELTANSGSTIKLITINEKTIINASSAGEVKIKGKANDLKISTSSAADVKAEDLVAQNAQIKASSGSDVNVYVTKKIEADASSGADIKNNALDTKISLKKESSGGNIQSP